MAPPKHRRFGFSRKAQYGLFLGYVVAVTGVLGGLGMLVASRVDPEGFGALRDVATDAVSPVSSLGDRFIRGIDAGAEAVSAYVYAGSKNRALAAELAADRAKLVQARALDFENRRLKRLLRLVERRQDVVAVARLVSSSASSTRRLGILDAGSAAGVRPGQPVRSPEGLVGRVLTSGRLSSHILLLTDSGSTVPVRLARTGVPALATGSGSGRVELRALIAGATPFRRGDITLTTGTGGVYPPNIPVSIITQVNGDTAVSWPLADPARLDFATVLNVYQPDAPLPAGPPGPPPR